VPGRYPNKLKNGWEPFYHLAKQPKIKFCPEQVMRPPKPSSIVRAKRLSGRDFTRRTSESGSGFSVDLSIATGRYANGGLALPDNVIECSPETQCKGHDSVFPDALPRFFINLLTTTGDTVLDPFAGSGTTAKVARDLGRSFVAIEKEAKNVRLIHERLSE